MATSATDVYVSTADVILLDTRMGSTVYEIVMLLVSGVILLITGIATLVKMLRKYLKEARSLEEASTGVVVTVTYNHEKNSQNRSSPPHLSNQSHSSCTCEPKDKKYQEKHVQRSASPIYPTECAINDIHITIHQTQ